LTNEFSDITQVLYDDQRVKDTLSRFLSQQNGIDLCSDSRTTAQVLEIYKKASSSSDPSNEKEIRMRFLTDINAENIPFCKELMKLTGEVRHLTGIKTNFAVRSREYIGIATLKEELLQVEYGQQKKKVDDEQQQEQSTQSQSHIIYSNIKGIIEQQQHLFNSLWEKAVPAEQRIKELEEDTRSEFFKVITDNKKISRILIDLINSVVNELLLLLPNDKALVRIDKLGIIDSLIKVSQNGAEVKIICPLSNENSQTQKKIADNAPDINILHSTNSRHGMYIVDRIKFLRVELVKPEAENFLDAIGFAVYSNNERSTELFRWMFELLWNERIVNEKSTRDDKIQDEFINIAAHELRSPAQSIFGYTELMLTDPEYKQLDKKEGYLDAIYRNSLRLTNLTTELLDISRIENQTLHLYKQEFKLNDVIFSVIQDIQKQRQGQTLAVIKDSGARIMYSSKTPNPLKKEEQSIGDDDNDNNNNSDDIFVEADKERITQVLTNLLDNALKFTKENDAISIVVEVTEDNQSNTAEVIIRIKDSGVGIDPEILPFLFTKFCTKPPPASRIRGTGLGLYICKWIVEAHEGRIWGYNNTHDKGATFLFSLPLAK
jgi:two-component system sensor histidine kinase VicK